MPRPFSKGYRGHAYSCDCTPCANHRANAKIEQWEAHGSQAELDPDKTVFVRSFWRKQRGHWKKMPESRKVLAQLIKRAKRKE